MSVQGFVRLLQVTPFPHVIYAYGSSEVYYYTVGSMVANVQEHTHNIMHIDRNPTWHPREALGRFLYEGGSNTRPCANPT